jgi:hypothetical protein
MNRKPASSALNRSQNPMASHSSWTVTCSDAIMHSFQVIRLLSWESFDANLLKPASFSSRSRFIIATWANSANSSGLWFLPYFRSLHKRFSHSCNWRGFRVDLWDNCTYFKHTFGCLEVPVDTSIYRERCYPEATSGNFRSWWLAGLSLLPCSDK